jgi:hypothetical protein
MNNPFETIEARLNNIETLLLDLKHEKNKPLESRQNRWMNVPELCAYLPSHPAKSTIYGNIDEIPHYKDKKTLRFLKSEIDAWLLKGKRKTPTEIDAEIERETNEFLAHHKKTNPIK